jgi:hypothetical protein
MVYLDASQMDALRRMARRERVSLAELIRRAVERYLRPEPASPPVPREAYERLIGFFSDDATDVSERHGHYIGEALYREYVDHSD